MRLKVIRSGTKLAVCLPASLVRQLHLESGDEIEIHVVAKREANPGQDRNRSRAIERLRKLRRPLPTGFDREETNRR